MQSTPTTETRPLTSPSLSLIRAGAGLGMRAGLWLSASYAILGTITLAVATGGLSQLWSLAVTYALFFVILLVFSLGAVPAVVYCAGTGAILGKLSESISGKTHHAAFVGLSMLICIGIALITHFMLRIYIFLSFHDTGILGPLGSYLFAIGIPTVIYILTGAWVGDQLYAKARGEKPTWNIPVRFVKRILIVALVALIPTIIALKLMGWFDYASNPAGYDGVVLQMWTSQPCVTTRGTRVHLRAEVRNTGQRIATITLKDKSVLDMCAAGACWSDNRPLTPDLTRLALNPGESRTIEMDWTKNNDKMVDWAWGFLREGDYPADYSWVIVPAGSQGCPFFQY